MHAFIYFEVVLIQFVFGQIYFLLLMLTLCIAFNCVNALFVCFFAHIYFMFSQHNLSPFFPGL